MEILLGLFMLIGGAFLAGVVAIAMSAGGAASQNAGVPSGAVPQLDVLGSSLLLQVLSAGGVPRDEALRIIRREAGIAAPPAAGIDTTSWAESFARRASGERCRELLETAVRIVAAPGRPVPLRQYAALLDLSFGLGFQTDALARLRTVYGFEYVDPAKEGRPRHAELGGRPPAGRPPREAGELRRILGVSPSATRQEIGAAYRRLAAQHHPDRFHGAAEGDERAAAERFIEITRAYEELIFTIGERNSRGS